MLSDRFTLLWLEFRLAQDAESLYSLERNCFVMQNWLLSLPINRNADGEKGFAHLRAWCGGVLGLLKEHGRFIQDFPDELHSIDIEPFFSSPHLRPGFCLTTGDQHVRERVVHLDDDIGGAAPKVEVEAHRQLLPQPEGNGSFGFILYDEKRDVFYYSESRLPSASETLWAQDRQTGQRLPPVKKALTPAPTLPRTLSGWDHINIMVVGAVCSGDGRYVGIVYTRHYDLYTTIWEIEDQLHFHDIKQSQPWARRLQCLHLRMPASWGYPNYLPIAVGSDNLFCTVHGLVDPRRGVQQGLPAYPLDPNRVVLPAFSNDGRSLFYFGDKFVVDSNAREFYKISWLDPIPTTKVLHLPDRPPALHCLTFLRSISHDGSYLVLTGTVGTKTIVYLVNTCTGAVNDLLSLDSDGLPLFPVIFWHHSLIVIT